MCICSLDSVFEWLYLLCIRAETGKKYPKNVHDGILLRETLPRILVRRGLETGIREEIRSLYTYISRVNHVIFDLGIFVSS